MIKVSDDFNNSVSKTEREMKGYVEILYSNTGVKENSGVEKTPTPLYINQQTINVQNMLDDDRKGKNYAFLEQDYFKLDGTFLLPNNVEDKNPGIGYVTNGTFVEDKTIQTTPFKFAVDTTQEIEGITIYFQNNMPLKLSIEIFSEDGTLSSFTEQDCTINDNGTVQLLFSKRKVDTLIFVVEDVLYPDRRIRIQEIDFGLSEIYENEDLISFKTIEQISRFSYEMPANECNVVIGDYEGKFDAINPKGIVKYLTDNVTVIPYVGVITENSGIEYCKLGHFWLDSYNLSSNQVTFNCKDIFNKLQDDDFNITLGQGASVWLVLQDLSKTWGVPIKNKVGYNSKDYIYDFADMRYKKINSKIDTLQKIATVCGNLFTSNREGEIEYISFKNNVAVGNSIQNNRLTQFEAIKIQDPIRDYKYTTYMIFDVDTSNNEYDGVQERYNEIRQCNGLTTMYFQDENYCYENYKCYLICDDYSKLEVVSSNCYVVDKNENMLYQSETQGPAPYMYVTFKYNGKMQCKISGSKFYRITKTENTINCNATGTDVSINNDLYTGWTNDPNISDMNFSYQHIVDYILENKSKYESSFEFNGNPAIECGDCIEVENKYLDENNAPRYDKIFVTKIQSEFKGSFKQSIEGDIIE
jgi:hypothetical protein